MKTFISNFDFLASSFPELATTGKLAEKNLYGDPNTSLFKTRLLGELLTEQIWYFEGLDSLVDNKQLERIKYLFAKSIIPGEVNDLFHLVRKKGNTSSHSVAGSIADAKEAIETALKLCAWFYEAYIDCTTFDSGAVEFIVPVEEVDTTGQIAELEAQLEVLSKEKTDLQIELQKALAKESEEEKRVRHEVAYKAAKKIKWTEEETRKLIDQQLCEAGWEADTDNLRFGKGTRPEKGRNLAIAEWPCGTKYVDYALFVGEYLVGLVEAKKRGTAISAVVSEAKMYGDLVEAIHGAKLLGKWGECNAPFLFASNSRDFHAQIPTMSGIWFLDARKPNNISRALRNWYTPEGLAELLKQNTDQADEALVSEDTDYLQGTEGLSLRGYQIKAIKAVEQAIREAEKPEERRALVAMATGTGKTRTVVGLAYRLIKAKRFKRILFLVDRSLLGSQTADTFNSVHIESNYAFSNIYDLKELGELIDTDTKLHIATVQSLVRRLLYGEGCQKPMVDDYDCIIVDEAHRGYILDKEMDQEDIDFKNEQDFMSKYSMVINYFDAFKVALTATPAQHTVQIFGHPVFRYTYRQAVEEGYLIDHEPPILIKTQLNQEGIKWQAGEKPLAYIKEEDKVIELDELPDELTMEVDLFNKAVITRPFNETVAEFLVGHIDPLGDEKTLIFAASDDHADMVVEVLKQAYQNKDYDVGDDHIIKITGNAPKPGPEELTNRFKNEKKPNIVVTVDLLTTGIDVPEICNLVFLRRTRSRILYEQMLGRATRKADHIGKKVFRIFDAVRIYEALEPFTSMTPVVVAPNIPFKQLVEELQGMDDNVSVQQKQIDKIVAKLERKNLSVEHLEAFEKLSEGYTPDELINKIKTAPNTKEAAKLIAATLDLWQWLDRVKTVSTAPVLIGVQPDTLLEPEYGYGDATKPEDYLESFKNFIENNPNKLMALELVRTKPNELTRDSLKELIRALGEHGYTELYLNKAWKDVKNEDIAADLIGFVRSLTMGAALESKEERIKRAMKKVLKLRKWTPNQEKWLKKIEDQLIEEPVLHKEDFNEEPFVADGGYIRFNGMLDNELDTVLQTISQELYAMPAAV